MAGLLESAPYYQFDNGRGTCHFLSRIKLSKVIIIILLVLVIVSFFTHNYLTKVSGIFLSILN